MNDAIKEIELEIFESQSEIIRLQSDVIDELFRLLLQHVTAEELDRLPVLKKMNQAATIRAELDH